MYHRFSETPANDGSVNAELFEQQVRYLQRHCELVSLSQALQPSYWKIGTKPKAVITIDDGYLDFFEIAYPILKKLKAPATFYVSTGFVDGSVWLWHDRLKWIIDNASNSFEAFVFEGRQVTTRDLEDNGNGLWRFAVSILLKKTGTQIESALKALAKGMETGLPSQPPREYAPVTWEHLRTMQANGIEIGGHTVSHYSLGQLAPQDVEREVLSCLERLDQELGQRPRPFCYPNGQPSDVPAGYREVLEKTGFTSATVAFYDKHGVADPYAIRRHGVGESWFAFMKTVWGIDRLGAVLLARNSLFDWGP